LVGVLGVDFARQDEADFPVVGEFVQDTGGDVPVAESILGTVTF
jgi:hypothetical protein